MIHETSNRSALFELVGVLARRRRVLGERYFALLGLNHSEARLLTLLDEEGGSSTQDVLSDKLGIDRSNAGRGLKGLEEVRCVVRTVGSSDRRTNTVRLTAKGRRAVKEISRLRIEMAQAMFHSLSEEQAGAIVDALQSVVRQGEKSDRQDPVGGAREGRKVGRRARV